MFSSFLLVFALSITVFGDGEIFSLDDLQTKSSLADWSVSSTLDTIGLETMYPPFFDSNKFLRWKSVILPESSTSTAGVLTFSVTNVTKTDWFNYTHFEFWFFSSRQDRTLFKPTLTISLSNDRYGTRKAAAIILIQGYGWKRIAIRLDMFKKFGTFDIAQVTHVIFAIGKDLETSVPFQNCTFSIMNLNVLRAPFHTFSGTVDYVLPNSPFQFNIPVSFNNTLNSSYTVLLDIQADNRSISELNEQIGLTSMSLVGGSSSVSVNSTASMVPGTQISYQQGSVRVNSFDTGDFSIRVIKNAATKNLNIYNESYLMINFIGMGWRLLVRLEIADANNLPIAKEPHPSFFHTKEDLINCSSSYRTSLINFSNSAIKSAALLKHPRLKARWETYFSCGFGKGSPIFDASKQGPFICKDGFIIPKNMNRELSGAWVAKKIGWILETLQILGITANLPGLLPNRTEYIQTGISILQDFSEVVKTMNLQSYQYEVFSTTSGLLTDQTLDDAEESIKLFYGLDLLYPFMSNETCLFIIENLVLPLTDNIRKNKLGTSNWQTFHNAAIYLGGRLSGCTEISKLAIDDPKNGFKFQMRKSVLSDGFWYEGSVGYHYYALGPLIDLATAETKRFMGEELLFYNGNLAKVELFLEPKALDRTIHSAILAPLYLALPDLSFPSINDMKTGETLKLRPANALGAMIYPSSKMMIQSLQLIGKSNSIIPSARFDSFFNGLNVTEMVNSFSLKSVKLSGLGYSILRSENGDYVTCDGGDTGGWHGHLDKLALVFYSRKATRVMDPGVGAYSESVSVHYLKKSLSHSLILINGLSQLPSTGNLSYFGQDISNTGSGVIYKIQNAGISAKRTLHFLKYNSILVDILFAYSDSGATYNLKSNINYVIHSMGAELKFPNRECFATNYSMSFNWLTGKSISGSEALTWIHPKEYKYCLPSNAATDHYDWQKSRKLRVSFETGEVNQWVPNNVVSSKATDGVNSLRWRNLSDTPTFVWNIPQDARNWIGFDSLSFDIFPDIMAYLRGSIMLVASTDLSPESNYYFYMLDVNGGLGQWETVMVKSTSWKEFGYPAGWSNIAYLHIYGDLTSNGATFMNNFDCYLDNFQVSWPLHSRSSSSLLSLWGSRLALEFDFEPNENFGTYWTSSNSDYKASISNSFASRGSHSLRWYRQDRNTQITLSSSLTNWSSVEFIYFDLYSTRATNSNITLILYSQYDTTVLSYFALRIVIDWADRWKSFRLPTNSNIWTRARSPVGWQKIDKLFFSSTWLGQPSNFTELYLDNFVVVVANKSGILAPLSVSENFTMWQANFAQNDPTLITFSGPQVDGTYSKAVMVGQDVDFGITDISEFRNDILTLISDSCGDKSGWENLNRRFPYPFVTLMTAYPEETDFSKVCSAIFVNKRGQDAFMMGDTEYPYMGNLSTILISIRIEDTVRSYYFYSYYQPHLFVGAVLEDRNFGYSFRGIIEIACISVPNREIIICLRSTKQGVPFSADLVIDAYQNTLTLENMASSDEGNGTLTIHPLEISLVVNATSLKEGQSQLCYHYLNKNDCLFGIEADTVLVSFNILKINQFTIPSSQTSTKSFSFESTNMESTTESSFKSTTTSSSFKSTTKSRSTTVSSSKLVSSIPNLIYPTIQIEKGSISSRSSVKSLISSQIKEDFYIPSKVQDPSKTPAGITLETVVLISVGSFVGCLSIGTAIYFLFLRRKRRSDFRQRQVPMGSNRSLNNSFQNIKMTSMTNLRDFQ